MNPMGELETNALFMNKSVYSLYLSPAEEGCLI